MLYTDMLLQRISTEAKTRLLMLVFITTFHLGYSFQPTSRTTLIFNGRYIQPKLTLLNLSAGDFFSGITGIAPTNLEPPEGLLSGTSIDPELDRVDLQRVYKASKDGWSAVDFHKCVDGRGSGLVVALTSSGKRFGAFNPIGWMSTDDYGDSNAAWLWLMDENNKDKAIRVPILMGGQTAIFDYATGGPCFGSSDLLIGSPKAAVLGGFAGPDMEDTSINAGDLRECSSSPGTAYESPPKSWPYGKSKLVEVEVYANANIDPSGSLSGGFKLWPF